MNNAPREKNWIEHHLMVKELMTSTEEFPLDHQVVYTAEMEEGALTMAMQVLDHEIPMGEDTTVGYTIVLGSRAYAATRRWDWGTGHFSHIHEPEQSKSGMKIMAWNSPVIVDPELKFCYVGFVDSHGDQHFVQIKGCWQSE